MISSNERNRINPSRGPKNPEDLLQDLQYQMGIVTERDLIAIFRVSDATIRLWESRGLESFKPGTSKKLFLISDVTEFLSRKESFGGKRRERNKTPGEVSRKRKSPAGN